MVWPPPPPNLAFAPPPSCTLPTAFGGSLPMCSIWKPQPRHWTRLGPCDNHSKVRRVPDGKATMDAMTFIYGNAELIADMHLRHLFVHTRPLCEKSMQSSARISSHVMSIYVYFISKQFLLTGQGLSKIGANGMTAGKKPQFSHWCWMSACQSAGSLVDSSQGSCPFRPAASCKQNVTLQKKNRRSSNVVSTLGQDVHLCGPTSDIISSNLTEKPAPTSFDTFAFLPQDHWAYDRNKTSGEAEIIQATQNRQAPWRRKHVLSLTDVQKMLLGSNSRFLTSTMQTVCPISMPKSSKSNMISEGASWSHRVYPQVRYNFDPRHPRKVPVWQSFKWTGRCRGSEFECRHVLVHLKIVWFFRSSSCDLVFVSGAAHLVCHAGAPLRHFCIIRFHIDRLASIGLDWKLVCLQHMTISVATGSKPRHPVFHGACPPECKMIFLCLGTLLSQGRVPFRPANIGMEHAIKSPDSTDTRPRAACTQNMAANWGTWPMVASRLVQSMRPMWRCHHAPPATQKIQIRQCATPATQSAAAPRRLPRSSPPPEPAQCRKCHACHAKGMPTSPSTMPATRWSAPSAAGTTPATQKVRRCYSQVPQLPRKVLRGE